jgi:glycine/D-amino acid oxidase-like deaminating enzyme
MEAISLNDGTTIKAGAFVFACGPWLGKIFPDVIGSLISPTRQEVYFLGTPPGDQRFNEGNLPIWVTFGKRVVYGIPGNERRGIKVGDDTRGEPFDPTDGDRTPTSSLTQIMREELRVRIPDLANAPLLEARVCQYEDTPDKNLIIDRHPEAENVWFVGGGSGHGFKLGPALGEHVAHLVLGRRQQRDRFQLSRSGLIEKRDSF